MTQLSQRDQVLKHLREVGPLTPLQAFGVYGIFRLAARIEELRLDGHDIDTVLRYDANGKQYAEYCIRKALRVGDKVQVKRGYGIGLPKWVRRTAKATIKGLCADAAAVEFRRGTKVEEHYLNARELVHVA